jgi:hypothetical protein
VIPEGQYDPKRADDLLWYLIQELRRTMSDRAIQESNWERWEKVYRARPSQEKKDFPWVGASNLVVPIAATDVETLFSRMMGLLFEPQNLWSITAQRPDMVDFAAATQEFMQWAQHNEIKPYRDVGNWLLEMHKLGTGVMKQRYTRDFKKVFEWREIGQQTWQQQAVILLNDHPTLNHVRLWDYYLPAGFPRIQDAPWCAERIRLTWMQFMNRVKQGIYVNADKIGSWFFNPPVNRVQQRMDDLSQYRASINQQMELYEFWLDYDIDGDGWDEALICTIHLDQQVYVRLDFNPFFNQEKPYSAGCFMPDVNSFYGIGLCEMLDHFQEEITAMHNQRIDNGTVANSQMYAVKKDNLNIRKNERAYPGKFIPMNDPKNDIVPIALGAGMGSALAAAVESESVTRQEAQRRTGVNDYVQANASPSVGYGAAYTTQQMLLQSDKRFGETLRSVRGVLDESGTRILELYQQYWQGGKPFIAQGPTDGQLTSMVLKFPTDLIRAGLKVTVTAIDSNTSKEAQIRTTTLVFQTLSQFYMQYMQLLSYIGNPQIPPHVQQVAMQAAEGGAVLMRRLLELYGQQDYERMIPELQGGANVQQRTLANIQSILQSGSLGGPPGSQTPSGVSGVPYGSAALSGGGTNFSTPSITQYAGNAPSPGSTQYA